MAWGQGYFFLIAGVFPAEVEEEEAALLEVVIGVVGSVFMVALVAEVPEERGGRVVLVVEVDWIAAEVGVWKACGETWVSGLSRCCCCWTAAAWS